MDDVTATGGVGRVLGTEDATPLHYWFALGPGASVQLDDVVMVPARRDRADPARGDEVAVRVLVVHAIDEDADRWYARFGFEPSPTNEPEFMLVIGDMRRTLGLPPHQIWTASICRPTQPL